MSFKQLVASYNEGITTWDDLILEVRCESCFTSVMDEMHEQLSPGASAPEMLADEFPDYYKSYAKERRLEK
ncbi:MAG: hypothetical protein VXZ59_01915 [Cyanobacteriota bacterium]|nr:hypothetical protein [Cyanobacteriota bacterium]